MTISTAAFGIYFYLMSKIKSTTLMDVQITAGEEAHPELAWLALASMAVFISGESHTGVILQLFDLAVGNVLYAGFRQSLLPFSLRFCLFTAFRSIYFFMSCVGCGRGDASFLFLKRHLENLLHLLTNFFSPVPRSESITMAVFRFCHWMGSDPVADHV